MADRDSLITILNAIAGSATAAESAGNIVKFAESLNMDIIAEFIDNPPGSLLGGIARDTMFMNNLRIYLDPDVDSFMLDWLQRQPCGELFQSIVSGLIQFHEERFSTGAMAERAELAEKMLKHINRMKNKTGDFMLLDMPRIREATCSFPGTFEAATGSLEGAAYAGKHPGLILPVPGTDAWPSASAILDALTERLAFEAQHMAAAYSAMRHAACDNRLLFMARMAASVPPSHHEAFWGERIFTTDHTIDHDGVISIIEELLTLHRDSGPDAAEEKLQSVSNPFLRQALQLHINGEDPETVAGILSIKKSLTLKMLSTLHSLYMDGIDSIMSGARPERIEKMKRDYTRIGEYSQATPEIRKKFNYFCEKTRTEGLLALEEEIFRPGSHESSVTGCDDAEAAAMPMSSLMSDLITMVIDGCDPEIVRATGERIAADELSVFERILYQTIDGALSVQCGTNPFTLDVRLSAYQAENDEAWRFIDSILPLVKKSGHRGVTALKEDIGNAGNGLFPFLLRLAVNFTAPDFIMTTAKEAARRIEEELGLYLDFCIMASSLLSHAMHTENIPASFFRENLAFIIPFYDSTRLTAFQDERKKWMPGLDAMRINSLKHGKDPLQHETEFPFAIAGSAESWDSFFSFREGLKADIEMAAAIHETAADELQFVDLKNISEGISLILKGKGVQELMIPAIEEKVRMLKSGSAALESEYEFIRHKLYEETGRMTVAYATDDFPADGETVISPDLLPEKLAADEIPVIIEKLEQILDESSAKSAEALAALLKSSGIKVPPEKNAMFSSLGDFICAYPRTFDFHVRAALYNDISDVYGKNSLSPANEVLLFSDIAILQDTDIQKILRCVDTHELIMALYTSDENLRTRILDNMSARAGALLIDDLAYVRMKDSRSLEAQRKIAGIMSRLVAEGEIALPEAEKETAATDRQVYGKLKDLAFSLIIFFREEHDRMVRREHAAFMKIIEELENKHGFRITRVINDWSNSHSWEVTPSQPGTGYIPEEKRIMDEIITGDGNEYAVPLSAEALLQMLKRSPSLLTIDRLMHMEDDSVSRVLYSTPVNTLTTAVKGNTGGTAGRIISLLPHDIALIVREDMAHITPSPDDVKKANEEIVRTALRLSSTGDLLLDMD